MIKIASDALCEGQPEIQYFTGDAVRRETTFQQPQAQRWEIAVKWHVHQDNIQTCPGFFSGQHRYSSPGGFNFMKPNRMSPPSGLFCKVLKKSISFWLVITRFP